MPPKFYECGTSSEEIVPTRLPEQGVENIMEQVKIIVSNHNDWLDRMERHLIYEAGIEHEFVRSVAAF